MIPIPTNRWHNGEVWHGPIHREENAQVWNWRTGTLNALIFEYRECGCVTVKEVEPE